MSKVKKYLALALEYGANQSVGRLDDELIVQINSMLETTTSIPFKEVIALMKRAQHSLNESARSGQATALRSTSLQAEIEDVDRLHKKYKALFAWYDGPLVQAMKRGDLFLIDEISLAEDSVLERLNR